MNAWLDFTLVALAVLASVAYAIYALGPRHIRNAYSRFATKYFGLRAAKWFVSGYDKSGGSCTGCDSNTEQRR